MSLHAADLGTFGNTITAIWWLSLGVDVWAKKRSHRTVRRHHWVRDEEE